MKFKKSTFAILSFLLVFTPLSQSISLAYNDDKSINNTVIDYEIPKYEMPKEEDYQYLKEERSVYSKVAKKAIRYLIRNKNAVMGLVRQVTEEDVAINISRYYDVVIDSVEPLLEWSEIPSQAVYDAVFRGMLNARLSRSTAAQIALAIKEVFEWVVF